MAGNSKHTIRFGGVPEHFNIPLYYGIQRGILQKNGPDITWTSYPGGTGAMLTDLKENRLDVATLLTEGAIAGILQGIPIQIAKLYVDSPLVWGVHTRNNAGITTENMEGKKYAISRFNSGSHLMPHVFARNYQLALKDPEDFVIVKDLPGARTALKQGDADIFFWEKFITQPIVDIGEFERIAECPTPWPSFVIAGRKEVLDNHYEALSQIFSNLHQLIRDLIDSGEIIKMVADEFGLKHFDAVRWYAEVEWNLEHGVDTEKIASTLAHLQETGLIKATASQEEMISRIVYPVSILENSFA